ncbi:MAG: PAS domain-containing protein [Calothrix sp. C42_A2020_038]|nr:PAS domain-containing protein [Calothrix sp. C42_A2020_038]
MLNGLLVAANSVISLSYFIIAFLIWIPFLQGQQKSSLVLATILVFFSCALGHGGHVWMFASSQHSPFLLKFQVGVDLLTACIAITYIALRRYFSFLVDAPLILNQTQEKLEVANAELKDLNTKLESLVLQRTLELSNANKDLAAKAEERKQMIAALNRSNAFLKAQQEAGVDGILVVDENKQVVFYNKIFYQIWQIPEELVKQEGNNRKILELAIAQSVHEEEFINKVNYLYQNREITSRDEILLKDGRSLDRYTTPIYSSEGTYYGRIWFFRDITERKTIEEELSQSKEFLQLLIDIIPLAIVWKDCDSVCLGCNQKFAAIAGLNTPDEVIGKTDYDFAWTKEEADFLRAWDARVIKSNQPLLHMITSQRQASGKQVWLDICKLPLRNKDGKVIGLLAVSEDITERKADSDALLASQNLLKQKAMQLEATLQELQQTQAHLIQSEKMLALGQLVAGVAHEINNPVNFIYGNLQHVSDYIQDLMNLLQAYTQEHSNPSEALLAQMKDIDYEYLIDDVPKLLSSMKLGAERIREIVLSLRTFSRLDEAAMKAVNVHDGIDATLVILQSRLKTTTGVNIQVHKHYGNLPDVECYPGQLNQVFMNVLCNAIDALETEANLANPVIEIQTEIKEQNHVVIKITDNGPGIPQSVQQNIFNPFFTTKPVGKGTGLGLSISYQIIVSKHKGNFNFTSTRGRTQFWIEIPLFQNPS